MEEVRKGVVEVYGGLPWRKNLHGSMGLSTYWVEDEENKRRRKKIEERRKKMRRKERESDLGFFWI